MHDYIWRFKVISIFYTISIIIESYGFGLKGTFISHLVQPPPCNEQGHLQLDQVLEDI